MREFGSASGIAAPQCGNRSSSGEWQPRSGREDRTGIAAPQCGNDGKSNNIDPLPGEWQPQSHKGWYSRGYLPHFDSSHVIQHITYHLADSLPYAALARMQAEVAATIRDDEKRKVELRQRIETHLDTGYGSCILREPEIARCVVDTWLHFDGVRYRLLEWVVMPNHCHVLIEPFEAVPLGKIVLSWKNFTARFINGYKRGESRTGAWGAEVWQREYWDRFVRNEHHLETVRQYIRMNPVKAGLAIQPEDWAWGSARWRGENSGR